ncbi:unnamed protein product [Macrosiphum euphorbiae]|uniref:Uncharacterized protein n=1 Tax=Macrosiphum euphorbiae TaxID=13131 RepID=A0AAV0VNA3_9HEMI|nr:unnamed protein product [Macrosiphum euphorbiae]
MALNTSVDHEYSQYTPSPRVQQGSRRAPSYHTLFQIRLEKIPTEKRHDLRMCSLIGCGWRGRLLQLITAVLPFRVCAVFQTYLE